MEKNERIFKDASSSVVSFVSALSNRIVKWALIRKEFANFTMNDIFVGVCTAEYARD